MGQRASLNVVLMQADIVDSMGTQAVMEAVKKLAGHEALIFQRCLWPDGTYGQDRNPGLRGRRDFSNRRPEQLLQRQAAGLRVYERGAGRGANIASPCGAHPKPCV